MEQPRWAKTSGVLVSGTASAKTHGAHNCTVHHHTRGNSMTFILTFLMQLLSGFRVRRAWRSIAAQGVPVAADTASFSGAMKTRFLGPIRDGLAKGKVLLFGGDDSNPEGFQGILRSAEGINFVGNDFRIPLKATRNQAVGFRSEGETLMMPGAGTYTYL